MSFNNGMATPFASHLFPHTEGTLLMYRASLAQQMAKNVKNESVYFNCSSIHFPLSSVQISAIHIQRSGQRLGMAEFICSKVYSLRKAYQQDEIAGKMVQMNGQKVNCKVRQQSFQGMYKIAQCYCAEAEDKKAKKQSWRTLLNKAEVDITLTLCCHAFPGFILECSLLEH